ncbi:MAG: TrkH family potassium uptake protein [Nitrospirota bacterium]|nr:TrkH family potassium uptake protein [Nitrospirota bacterium]MDH5585585.1 TrkH family potassium uptake protein [Nitrospirota bacterium]MDH5774176.1 TrkH family potassium uptake protein [Nitrospirota bacterium]
MNAGFGQLLIARFMGFRLMPGQVVALAAMGLILLGACFLMLPFATVPGANLGFIDALFTATSAVCVTGLIVMDTPQDFTTFGLGVILFLIQIGGLGYALMATMILLILGRRLGLRDRMMLSETMSTMDMQGLVRFVKLVTLITFSLEGIGAVLLTFRFAMDYPWDTAFYYGVFHAISAFNNAGFALFSDSLGSFQKDWSVNVIVTTLVILGSIGFLVFEDLLDNIHGRRFRFRTHTKLVVVTTGMLIAFGTFGIAMLEWNNPATMQGLSVGETFTVSYFHAVSRTAGFTSLDLGGMREPTLYFLLILMAIGGSPGSMSGGIKTTTIAIVFLTIWSVLRRDPDVEVFHRRIPPDLITRALCLTLLALALITGMTLLLASTESQPFLSLMFEVTSAMGIVGLSLGDGATRSLSALLTDFGKVMIMLSMLLGRFGPLMIGLFAVKTTAHKRYRFAQSRVVIG